MNCDVREATEGLEKRRKGWRSDGRVGEATEGLEKRRKGWRSDGRVGEATEGLENELSLRLRHSSFSNLSFASPTSQDLHLRRPANRPCEIGLSGSP